MASLSCSTSSFGQRPLTRARGVSESRAPLREAPEARPRRCERRSARGANRVSLPPAEEPRRSRRQRRSSREEVGLHLLEHHGFPPLLERAYERSQVFRIGDAKVDVVAWAVRAKAADGMSVDNEPIGIATPRQRFGDRTRKYLERRVFPRWNRPRSSETPSPREAMKGS